MSTRFNEEAVEAAALAWLEVLAHRFHITIMRTVHNLQPAFDGVPIQDVQFQSKL